MRLLSRQLGYKRLFHHFAISAAVLSTNNHRSFFAYSMSTHSTERSNGTITVAPRNEAAQSALVVICHGLGDSAEGFADVAEVCFLKLWLLYVVGFLTSSYSIITDASRENAICQVHLANGTHATSHNEHGNAHAFLVRYCRFGRTIQ